MKKILYPLLTLVLALSLTIPLATVAAAQPADTIYGIANSGDIYEVGPVTSSATWVAEVDTCPTGGSGPNGLAFDQDSHRIFYTNYPASTTYLYYIDLDDPSLTEVMVGLLTGEIACADFYNGNYYYIAGGTNQGFTDNLYEVAINPDGTMGTVTEYADISGSYNRAYGFWGDIAIQDGVIYGFGSYDRGSHFDFFRVNCNGSDFTIIETVNYGYQLAFGTDGTLYGHNYPTGDFYTITWAETSVTATWLSNSTNHYTDLASGMTSFANPSLTITKSTTWTGFATIDDVITYNYEVENTGDVILDDLTVEDDKAGTASPVESSGYNVGDDNPQDGNFDPGEIWEFEASYTVVEADLQKCKLHNIATAIAYYEGEPYDATDELDVDLAKIITLCAGQHIPVGTVTVVNDNNELTVTYETTGGWLMTELHLHVAENLEDIPQTQPNKKGKGGGNPIPGHFDENVEFDPPTDYWQKTYDLDDETWIPCVTDLVIAAHAVVVFFDEICIDFEAYSEFDTVGTESTPNGDVNFYMTDYTSLAALDVGDYAALLPSSHLPVVASPGTNDNPTDTYPNIVAFTTGGPQYTGADDIVLDDHGTGAGGNTLTDPQDESQTELMWHAYSQFLGIVIDVSALDWVEDMGLVTIDLDHGELWHFLYFDADGMLIHKDTIAAGTGNYDGEAFPISWTDDAYSIAKVVVFGEMNNNDAGIVGYAIDNICITSVVQEETAWGGGDCDDKPNVKDFPGANWATYFTYHVMLCNGD